MIKSFSGSIEDRFEKAELFLHELSLWPEGWDGEGAFPIARKTVCNCQDLLSDKQAHVGKRPSTDYLTFCNFAAVTNQQ